MELDDAITQDQLHLLLRVEPHPSAVSRWIRTLADQHGMERLAYALRMPETSVLRWEQGRYRPRRQALAMLEALLLLEPWQWKALFRRRATGPRVAGMRRRPIPTASDP